MKNELFILWTNADPITSEKMVFMYAHNSILKQWWEKVTVIVWGATAKYVADNKDVQNRIIKMINDGVNFSACISCAEQLGVQDILKNLDIELIKWGEPLTEILKEGRNIISI